jgi:hypothetical protein
MPRFSRCAGPTLVRRITVVGIAAKAKTGRLRGDALLANENQNARRKCQDSHYDCRDGDVKEQSDSCENQIDGQKEHSEVFGDVHGSVSEAKPVGLHALNCVLLDIISFSTEPKSRHSFRVQTSYLLERLSRALLAV